MTPLFVLVPAVAGLAALLLRADTPRRVVLVGTALAHLGMTASAWLALPTPSRGGWLGIDPLGLLVLTVASVLFAAASVYALGYLSREERGSRRDFEEEGVLFNNAPEAVFTCCLLLFLASMSLVATSRHLGLLWVAVEATTLASAPLIYFHRHHRSLEAAWKYLLICSVGIALALLGNFFLAVAARGGGHASMVLGDLLRGAGSIDAQWLRAAFVFLLVGYGTKMGLAPLHTWLPDAHGESPSVVSALLSGALLPCAFLGILRALQVCEAAGQGDFARGLLVFLGLLSLFVAAVYILGQADYKRLLAYSSVEHMGILALGVGVGGQATYGALLHVLNHGLAKGMLFLTAGNILAAYRTKSTRDARGVLAALPASGVLWTAGFLAITGTPPFGTFLSELVILRGAVDAGRYALAAAYLALLALVFVGMVSVLIRMAMGEPPVEVRPVREQLLAVGPPAALGALALMLGLYVPTALRNVAAAAATMLGGVP